MRIAIICPGSRGDVQPYVALGAGLSEAGHEVRLITHENFESLVFAHGLEFWPIIGDVRNIVQNQVMREIIEKGNFLTLLAKMAKEAQQGAVKLAQGSLAACSGVDVVLAGMGGLYVGLAIAEKLMLPLIQAYLVPFTPTQQFPSVLAPNLPNWLGGDFFRFSHHLTRQVMWQGFRSADRIARLNVLDIDPSPVLGPYGSEQIQGQPILYGISPSVIPNPADWGKDVYVTGYWFLDEPENWEAPQDLVDFLESGSPPVYIGFGSMSNRKPKETTDLIIEALRQSGQRGVLLSGWGGLHSDDLPDTIFMIDSIPHGWLFPKVSALVHHGGAGTTAAGLRAGVPTVIVPFFGDQHFWGQWIAKLGVGTEPIPYKKLTAERLALAIQTAAQDHEIRKRAADLGIKIQNETGINNAVQIINNCEKQWTT